MSARHRLKLPLIRLGLLLVIGSLAVSVFRFYVAFGAEASDMSGREPPLDRYSVMDQFVHQFLFSGGIAGVLFWAGIAVVIVGVARGVAALTRR